MFWTHPKSGFCFCSVEGFSFHMVEVNGGGQPSVVKARWILGQRNDRHNLLDVEKKSSGESSLFYPNIVGMHVKQTPKWSTVMIMYLLIAFQCYVLCYWIFIPFLIPIEMNDRWNVEIMSKQNTGRVNDKEYASNGIHLQWSSELLPKKGERNVERWADRN